MKRKIASFADFKRIHKMTLNDFNLWMQAFYQSAYEDGLHDGEAEFEDCVAAVYEDQLFDVLLSIKGIGENRAKQIVDAILKEGVFNGSET